VAGSLLKLPGSDPGRRGLEEVIPNIATAVMNLFFEDLVIPSKVSEKNHTRFFLALVMDTHGAESQLRGTTHVAQVDQILSSSISTAIYPLVN
jgi:hypothetical protein